jgi:small redox-active disulfide protein 2
MKIEILGTGCAKCKALEEATKQAVSQSGKFAQIEKVEDIMKIMEYQVMSTPALVIDGKVVSTGKLLSVNEIVELIKAQ